MSTESAPKQDEQPEHVESVAKVLHRLIWESRRGIAVNILVGVAAALCAAAALKYFEGWSFMEAAFILCQIQTTVGYGGFHVTTWHGQMILAIYSLASIVIASYLLKFFMQRLSNRYEVALRHHLQKLRRWEELEPSALQSLSLEHEYGSLSKVLISGVVCTFFILVGTFFFRYVEHCACAIDSDKEKCDESSFETCAATGGSIKTFSDAFYMSVATLCAVGFGEVQPRTNVSKGFCMAWMFFGVISTANFITSVSEYIHDGRWRSMVRKCEFMLDIHEKEFAAIDTDKSGDLSSAEFLVYTLRKYGCISEDLVAVINREFDTIDSDGKNSVTLQMLQHRRAGVQEVKGALDHTPFLKPLPKERLPPFGNVKRAISKWRQQAGKSKGDGASNAA